MMLPIIRRVLQIALVSLVAPCFAWAVNPAQWLIVEEVTRSDTSKTWNSPTAVDLGKMVWQYDYEITKVTGTVSVPFVGELTEDITSSIPTDIRVGAGEISNLPAVLMNDMMVEPETGTSANMLVEVDSFGFGHAVFSDIVLGSVDVPLFGNRPIQRINIEASVNIFGYDFGDYNRDRSVDAADYVMWRKDEGTPAGYDSWRANFGAASSSGSGLALGAVPEPSSAGLLFIAGAWFTATRCRRSRL
jgi:hypothetical protein